MCKEWIKEAVDRDERNEKEYGGDWDKQGKDGIYMKI